ncbi:MAG: serine--tRNA ligase [Fimbriimonadaceae bacterium]
MLDRNFVRNEPEQVRKLAQRKGLDAPVDQFTSADENRRAVVAELDELRARLNQLSKEVGNLFKQGQKDEAEKLKEQAKRTSDEIARRESDEREADEALAEVELLFPNLPHESVPDGTSSEDNVVVREWAPEGYQDREVPPHWEIAEHLDILDFKRASKISGSGFALYKGAGARLQRSLIWYMIERQVDANGYQEVYPPYLVLEQSLLGTGQLPKFRQDLYEATDGLMLIPTAEVPVTNIYRDEILSAEQLPTKLAAYSACFRREAGAAGADTRGLLRLHQFDKVELVQFSQPETSYEAHESLVRDAELILQELGVRYRVVLLCAGDMSMQAAKCYDLEIWSPGTQRWLEISSCSNFEAWQARRMNLRFRREPGAKPEFVHTLNGSGLATPRLFAVLLEQGHQPDGSVQLPEPLAQYMNPLIVAA